MVEVVSQDRFFKKPAEMPTYFSAINQGDRPAYNEPDSFKREEMLSYCRGLNSGDVVILEGILVLWFAELRALMDCKIYIDADADDLVVVRDDDDRTLFVDNDDRHLHLAGRDFGAGAVEGGVGVHGDRMIDFLEQRQVVVRVAVKRGPLKRLPVLLDTSPVS